MRKLITFLIVLYIAATAPGQQIESSSAPQFLIKDVINESSWIIPGLLESRIVSPRHLPPLGFGASAAPVYITGFQPKREVIKLLPFSSLNDAGRTLILNQKRIAIRSILKCDVDGRVFAYVVQGVGAFYDPRMKRGGYGGQYGFYYYDNDGDGKFESYEQGGLGVGPDLRVPEWALRKQ